MLSCLQLRRRDTSELRTLSSFAIPLPTFRPWSPSPASSLPLSLSLFSNSHRNALLPTIISRVPPRFRSPSPDSSLPNGLSKKLLRSILRLKAYGGGERLGTAAVESCSTPFLILDSSPLRKRLRRHARVLVVVVHGDTVSSAVVASGELLGAFGAEDCEWGSVSGRSREGGRDGHSRTPRWDLMWDWRLKFLAKARPQCSCGQLCNTLQT